jgi:hypothetical protein
LLTSGGGCGGSDVGMRPSFFMHLVRWMFNPAIDVDSNKLQMSHNCGMGGSTCASESSTITHNSVTLKKQADVDDVINIFSA